MRHTALIIIIALLSLTPLQAQVKHYEYRFENFSELVNWDDVNIEHTCLPDSAGLVSFEAPDSIGRRMIFNCYNGKLHVQIDLTSLSPETELPTVRVYSDSLTQVSNDGTGTVTVNGPCVSSRFKATLSDNGRIVINNLHCEKTILKIVTGKGTMIANGETGQLQCSNLGTGTIDALNLNTKKANCKLVGTGNIWVNCPGAPLTVRGAGTGTVSYRGTPSKITKRKMGPIKVVPYPAE